MERGETTDHEHFSAETAADHLLVYVKWGVIRQWKRQERDNLEETGRRRIVKLRPQLPYIYGSCNTTFKAYVRPGAVIWIVTCPEYGERPKVHRLPPMLVARLHVMDAVPWKPVEDPSRSKRIPSWFPVKWQWIGIACPDCSTYLPVNNVYDCLKDLNSRSADGAEKAILPAKADDLIGASGPYTYMPHQLRLPKRLASAGIQRLIDHARNVENRRTVFLSYRRLDHSEIWIGELVESLTRLELAVWLDMKAVPKPVATGKIKIDEDRLKLVLSDGIRQARIFVALVGPGYKNSEYAMEEWHMAKAAAERDAEFTRLQVSKSGCRIDESDAPKTISASDSAEMTASRIREAIDSLASAASWKAVVG